MATRTVRLDPEAEQVLAALTRSTGHSISDVLKQGLLAYQRQTQETAERGPYEVFSQLDLGPGGYARSAARDAKTTVRTTIARKHGR
jgi:negative regulator of replication initiation